MLLEKVAIFWSVCLALIFILLLALRLIVSLSGARRRRHGIAALHHDQRGSVQSLSFVLTLPVFIMIIMSIVQISQIMLAKVVVEYAALASARAASVWTSQYVSRENDLAQAKSAYAVISLAEQPEEQSTITLRDANGLSVTFETDANQDGVSPGNIALNQIERYKAVISPPSNGDYSAGAAAFLRNLYEAIESHDNLSISACNEEDNWSEDLPKENWLGVLDRANEPIDLGYDWSKHLPKDNELLLIQNLAGTAGNTEIRLLDKNGVLHPSQSDPLTPLLNIDSSRKDAFDDGTDISSQDLTDVSERNCLGDRRYETGNTNQGHTKYVVYHGASQPKPVGSTPKVKQILTAAHLACLPICPSQWPYGEPPVVDSETDELLQSLEKAYGVFTGPLADRERDSYTALTKNTTDIDGYPYLKNKLAYSMGSQLHPAKTRINIEIEHPQSEPSLSGGSCEDDYGNPVYCEAYQVNPAYRYTAGRSVYPLASIEPCPGDDCPSNFGSTIDGQAMMAGSDADCLCGNRVKYHPNYYAESQLFKTNQVGWQDRIIITVYHDLALLPGPAKLLAKMMYPQNNRPSTNPQDQPGTLIEEHAGRETSGGGSFYTWPLIAKASVINEGELPILRYEHPKNLEPTDQPN